MCATQESIEQNAPEMREMWGLGSGRSGVKGRGVEWRRQMSAPASIESDAERAAGAAAGRGRFASREGAL